jgi:hypothetical protein
MTRFRTSILVVAVFALSLTATASGITYETLSQRARLFAGRTYVESGKEHRHFFLWQPNSWGFVEPDQSTITAFTAGLASADGTGDIVLLFHNNSFVGWAGNRMAVNIAEIKVGHRSILVRYAVYRGRDPICCPSGFKTISYRWNGAKIVASAQQPRAWGKVGLRLHLSPP